MSVSGNHVSLGGTESVKGASYRWSATSQGAPTMLSTGASPCDGRYKIAINGQTGAVDLSSDASGSFEGYLSLKGYNYSLSGTCSASTISFTNLPTGSAYTGTVSGSGTSQSMSGTFTDSGSTYNWSATHQ